MNDGLHNRTTVLRPGARDELRLRVPSLRGKPRTDQRQLAGEQVSLGGVNFALKAT